MKSSPSEIHSNGSPGYTLMELIVAMSLLLLLGGGLVTLLGQGVRIWTTAESRGRAYDAARAVLDRVSEDLRSVVTTSTTASGQDWTRLIADRDRNGRQRLRFVRATSGEAADAILREGGRYVLRQSPALLDGRDDAEEAARGELAAPGGLMEILYAADPRPGGRSVWRGVRSPVGGPGSLLLDANAELKGGSTDPRDEPARPVADGVLYLGFAFWGWTTNTWEPVPPLREPRPGQASGPNLWWDSTRALLDVPAARAGELGWTPRAGSLDDPGDDVFPELVEITVVVADRSDALSVYVLEDVSDKERSIPLSAELLLPEDPLNRYVLIEDEWVQIEGTGGRRLEVEASGRGARFTKAVRHERGARVEVGLTFRRVIEIPAHRRPPLEESSARRRRAGGRG